MQQYTWKWRVLQIKTTVWVLQSHGILYWLYYGTSAGTSYCPASKWTIPCILAGGDHSVSYWQPRSACQLAAYVLLLERLCSSFMWMLPTTRCVSCFPFISPPLSFCVLLHNKCAVPQYLEGAQVVEALRYKPECRGFDSRWCHWNFSLT